MKYNLLLLVMLTTFGFLSQSFGQENANELTVNVSFAESVKSFTKSDARLYLFLSKNDNSEPRFQIWPNPYSPNHIFAVNMHDINADADLTLDKGLDWQKTVDWTLDNIPNGEYSFQLLWDQDISESRIDAPGNLYSTKQKITIDGKTMINDSINKIIPARAIDQHPLAKEVYFKSDTLSNWWGKEMHLRASILLPHNYTAETAYPIRYNVAGYGGRYTRINRLLNDEEFMAWWESDESPQVINVFLDGEGPFGDSYQMDSENSGPFGHSLIHELIPHIESTYRGTDAVSSRFVDGCSTGGWVSLGLQLYYPDHFNGVFSYSPDAIEFENYQLINIYKDENAFYNEFGYLRPVMREINGEPLLSMKEFIAYENVLGSSDTYLNSGGQFSAHTALYSPKGENSLPKPMFDPEHGEIDSEVAEHWKKYDFKLYAKENWATLGPKLAGKIFIWMGDMDHFYLNPATRKFSEFIKSTANPKSDATIKFSAMEGHCSQFSDRIVLEQIQEKLIAISN